jgi:tetratricopeptide (TPR) repeat protein
MSIVLGLSGCASSLERARKAKDQKDYAKAENYYRTSIGNDPEDKATAQKELAALKVTLAHSKLKKGDPAAAEKLFREALVLAPGDEKATDGLGRALAEQGKIDEAIAALQRRGRQAVRAVSRRYLAVLRVARVEARAGRRRGGGARDYEQANTLVPDVSTALAIARMAEGAGDTEATLKAVEAAVPLIREDDAESQRAVQGAAREGGDGARPAGDLATAIAG